MDNKRTIFSESDADFSEKDLSPEARRAFDASRPEVQNWIFTDEETTKILAWDGVKAGFKIEIFFGPGRSTRKEFKALISLYESGKHFHGGGDGSMYICFDQRILEAIPNTRPISILSFLKKAYVDKNYIHGCGYPIIGSRVLWGEAFCDGCGRIWKSINLTANMPFFGSIPELVELVSLLFHKLNDNADFYCKYDRTDIRYIASEKTYGFEKTRENRARHMYPLARLVKDTANGASLSSKLKAFFCA